MHAHRLAGPNREIYGHWKDEWHADPSQIRTDVFYQVAPTAASAGSPAPGTGEALPGAAP
jgi:hypothetical protein